MDNNFNFSFPLQMRWNDLDALGHVNNAIFVTYFEVGRGRFMMAACPTWNWKKDMFLIGNVTVNFHKELLLTAQQPMVHIRTSKIGTKSFTLEYQITSLEKDAIVVHATGSTTQIMFDMKSRTTIEIPAQVRDDLMRFDN